MLLCVVGFVAKVRSLCGTKYGHQGRSRLALDRGGLLLLVGRELGLTELEELGYASYPENGRFEQLLDENTENLNWSSVYPHGFDGTELKSGDLLAFDYCNGEGVRHSAIVSRFDGKRY